MVDKQCKGAVFPNQRSMSKILAKGELEVVVVHIDSDFIGARVGV